MELGGVTAARLAARGEAEFFVANGSMTPEAQADFEKAIKLDPLEPRAQYYLGLADIRDGNKDKAIARWKKLLANAPKDAPWRASVEADLAKLLQPAPLGGPTMADAQAAGNMTPEARQQMIGTMVARLAGRLEQNPNDLPGWLRLIRSYGVLGKLDEAKQALVTARKTFAGDKSALAQLDDAEKALPSK
jgi:cytochrome c-type biogenesis protein CcmH